jgi:hypothetical protein
MGQLTEPAVDEVAAAGQTYSLAASSSRPLVTRVVALIEGRAVAGDRREPRPERSGRRPGPRSTSRSIPTTRRSDHAEYARLPPRAGMLSLNVAHLEPDHHRAACGAGRAPGHFEESRAEKEHHPRISRGSRTRDRSPEPAHRDTNAGFGRSLRGATEPGCSDVHVPYPGPLPGGR